MTGIKSYVYGCILFQAGLYLYLSSDFKGSENMSVGLSLKVARALGTVPNVPDRDASPARLTQIKTILQMKLKSQTVTSFTRERLWVL